MANAGENLPAWPRDTEKELSRDQPPQLQRKKN